MLRYLPSYFDFSEDQETESPKGSKRQKVIEKQEMFAQLLKPTNISDCDFESYPEAFTQKLKLDGK